MSLAVPHELMHRTTVSVTPASPPSPRPRPISCANTQSVVHTGGQPRVREAALVPTGAPRGTADLLPGRHLPTGCSPGILSPHCRSPCLQRGSEESTPGDRDTDADVSADHGQLLRGSGQAVPERLLRPPTPTTSAEAAHCPEQAMHTGVHTCSGAETETVEARGLQGASKMHASPLGGWRR